MGTIVLLLFSLKLKINLECLLAFNVTLPARSYFPIVQLIISK